jgi:hypothetical protein
LADLIMDKSKASRRPVNCPDRPYPTRAAQLDNAGRS